MAVINGGGPTAVQAPAPAARLVDCRVELTWRLPHDGDDADGCHVYRVIDGRETRLTSRPLTPSAGGYVFSDEPAGLAPGDELAYSYAIVRGGTEIARSPRTAVAAPAAAILATQLLPNVPNPFNPETEIRFALARTGRVRVAVYDVAGRRVAVLVDEERAAGRHRVTWQGRGDAGRLQPSGAYYVSLETATGRDTRKILLLK